jgi:hypothetical protein
LTRDLIIRIEIEGRLRAAFCFEQLALASVTGSSDDKSAKLLLGSRDPAEALVDAALEAGGVDNVSVIVASVFELGCVPINLVA